MSHADNTWITLPLMHSSCGVERCIHLAKHYYFMHFLAYCDNKLSVGHVTSVGCIQTEQDWRSSTNLIRSFPLFCEGLSANWVFFVCVFVCSQNKGMGGTDAKRADHINRHSQRYGTPNTGKHEFLSLSVCHTHTDYNCCSNWLCIFIVCTFYFNKVRTLKKWRRKFSI